MPTRKPRGQERRPKPPQPLDPKEAIRAALARLRTEFVLGADDLARLVPAATGEMQTILDLNGTPLFYDVQLGADESAAGVLRVAASETIGTALVAVELGPRRWDAESAFERAKQVARERFPGMKVTGMDLVCYCYPKVGVRVGLEDEQTGTRYLILDVADLEPVERLGAHELEGFTAYSFYAEVVDRGREWRERRYARQQEHYAALQRIAPELFEERFDASEQARLRLREVLYRSSPLIVDKLRFVLNQQRILPYGPRCNAEEDLHLYAQQTNVFCAVATGQMILDWHRWYYTQDEIATAMSTGPGGTTNPNQVAGYQSLTNNSFVATYDSSAQWSEAKAEIDGGRPLKSGIPGHARACNGYRKTFNFTTSSFDYAIRVYDPWPWNADICAGGAVYWEDWDAVTHTNWIFVRHA